MSYAIDIVLSKAALRIAVEQLREINAKVKEKQPTHEWIEKNSNCIQDLTEAYYFIVKSDSELMNLRRANFNLEKMLREKEIELEKAIKEVDEIRKFL
jgi:hypothetical protein